MKVITLLNEKGGVGKTTLATHIAAGLAARGRRVILIDADPQGHSTVRHKLRKEPGLYDLLVRDAAWADVTRLVPAERYQRPGDTLNRDSRLFIVPSNVETRNIANSISEADLFAMRLDELRDMVDVAIIDTSPTPSLLHGAIYTATDGIIYPTMLSYTSFDGLVESVLHRQAADKTRAARWGMKPIDVLGIVPVALRQQTVEHQQNAAELVKQFRGLVWPPLVQRVIWQESESAALPVWALDPASPAAREIWKLVDRVEEYLHVPTQR